MHPSRCVSGAESEPDGFILLAARGDPQVICIVLGLLHYLDLVHKSVLTAVAASTGRRRRFAPTDAWPRA